MTQTHNEPFLPDYPELEEGFLPDYPPELEENHASHPQKEDAKATPIGRTSATERDASTVDEFHFWLAPGVIINRYDIVAVDQVCQPGIPCSRTFGIVTEIEHRTDAQGHLDNYISSNYGQELHEEFANSSRVGTTVATAQVMSNTENVYMPVPTDRLVYFANSDEIRQAIGADAINPENAIPAGIIKMTNGTSTPVYLDRRYVLGPDGGHVTTTGISGLAAKTSYNMFLLSSIQQAAPSPEHTALIILNVKHGDLLQIDQPNTLLSEEHAALWHEMGLEPRPFKNVRYFLPRSTQAGVPNCYQPIPPEYTIYAYDLAATSDKLQLLLSDAADPAGTIEGLCHEIGQRFEEGDKAFINMGWNDLYTFLQGKIKGGWENTRGSSIGKFCRHLRRIYKNLPTGIFTDSRSRQEKLLSEEIANIQGGSVYVVDIAKLKDDEMSLVVGDILQTIMEGKQGIGERTIETPFPEKVVIYVDELNKYAPTGKETPITTQILEMTERGRGAGVILFGAEQFMSQVHDRVIGNCSTKIIGRSGGAEVTKPVYSELGDQEVRASATRLEPGEMLISHPLFRHSVKVTFPRPAYQQPKG